VLELGHAVVARETVVSRVGEATRRERPDVALVELDRSEAHALEFVRAFMDYWDRHRAILRVRDLRAEEGDKRFWSARLDGYAAIIPGFTAMIEKGQAAGSVSSELSAYAAASALAAMMERLVTYQSEFGRRGVSTEAMTATLATILFQTVTGFTS